jgi:hypothetical protein
VAPLLSPFMPSRHTNKAAKGIQNLLYTMPPLSKRLQSSQGSTRHRMLDQHTIYAMSTTCWICLTQLRVCQNGRWQVNGTNPCA